MKQNKEAYVSPRIEVIEMENEGVIAASGGVSNFPENPIGASTYSSGRNSRSYNASSSDLEDLINDILTVGE